MQTLRLFVQQARRQLVTSVVGVPLSAHQTSNVRRATRTISTTNWSRSSRFECSKTLRPRSTRSFGTSKPNSANHRYQRFESKQRPNNPFQLLASGIRSWATHPHFYYHVSAIGAAGGTVYVYNLETVAISGRRRFNILSPEWEKSIGGDADEATLQQYQNRILDPSDPRHRMVQEVLDRLAPSAAALGMGGENKWEVHVIDDPGNPNAFVTPTGKVFVFTGILPICAGKDGLAAVLGHELAHVLARHSAEKLSQVILLIPLVWTLSMFFDYGTGIFRILAEFMFARPGSRKQESEADYIGLLMMARSCFRPEAALGVWQRMQQLTENEIPAFLSTHPTNKGRYDQIEKWLPKANEQSQESGCAGIMGYAREFKELPSVMKWR